METNRLILVEKANPILEVAVELGIKIHGSMGKCFRYKKHSEGTDDFTLFFNLARNSFFCKFCVDVGGNVIDLVGQHQGWDRQTAIDWLEHRIEFDRQTREMYYQRARRK